MHARAPPHWRGLCSLAQSPWHLSRLAFDSSSCLLTALIEVSLPNPLPDTVPPSFLNFPIPSHSLVRAGGALTAMGRSPHAFWDSGS